MPAFYWRSYGKYSYNNFSSLSAIYNSSKFKVLKMVKMKNKKNFTNKKPDATPYFCKRNFSPMHHIDFIHTLLSVPSLLHCLISTAHMQHEFETEEWTQTQSMDKIHMVHLRKISLAEIWGSIRFFICNFLFVFHFDHF